MHDAPSVSVIVPVCNGERFLRDALRSVLEQTRASDEVIVVDDGSTDGTAAIVATLAAVAATTLHYVHQSNQGPAAARNHGLRLARGAFIAFQDADDLWVAGRLAQQMAILEHKTDALAVIGQVHLLHTEPAASSPAPALSAPLLLPSMPSGLYRRAAFEIVGEFDAALRFHEDIAAPARKGWLSTAIATSCCAIAGTPTT
jgi:glycosyltransferase involved in cell wall biosynthesis